MIPSKLSVKVFAPRFDSEALPRLIPIFHRWISQRVLDEVLIDVADYRHVFRGPGITLVGVDTNYYLDESDDEQAPGADHGGWGLVCFRKRAFTASRYPVQDALRRALTACDKLEREFGSAGGIFDAGSLEIRLADRSSPPAELRWDELVENVRSQLSPLYGAPGQVDLRQDNGLPGMRVSHGTTYVASSILERLTGRRTLLS